MRLQIVVPTELPLEAFPMKQRANNGAQGWTVNSPSHNAVIEVQLKGAYYIKQFASENLLDVSTTRVVSWAANGGIEEAWNVAKAKSGRLPVSLSQPLNRFQSFRRMCRGAPF